MLIYHDLSTTMRIAKETTNGIKLGARLQDKHIEEPSGKSCLIVNQKPRRCPWNQSSDVPQGLSKLHEHSMVQEDTVGGFH